VCDVHVVLDERREFAHVLAKAPVRGHRDDRAVGPPRVRFPRRRPRPPSPPGARSRSTRGSPTSGTTARRPRSTVRRRRCCCPRRE
jgi:hypothetical protein